MAFRAASLQEYGISMAHRSTGCGNCGVDSLATTTSRTVRLKPTRQAITISHAPLEPRRWLRCRRHLRLIKQIIALQVAAAIANCARFESRIRRVAHAHATKSHNEILIARQWPQPAKAFTIL